MPEPVATAETHPAPPSALRRFVQSSLVYGVVAMPALWLLGGARGLRLLGTSAAVGAAVTATHATLRADPLGEMQIRRLVRDRAARLQEPLFGTPERVIDISGGDANG